MVQARIVIPQGISSLPYPMTLACTGLAFREWNLKAAARGEEMEVVRRLRLVMQPLADRLFEQSLL